MTFDFTALFGHRVQPQNAIPGLDSLILGAEWTDRDLDLISHTDAFIDWLRDTAAEDPIEHETRFGYGWLMHDFVRKYMDDGAFAEDISTLSPWDRHAQLVAIRDRTRQSNLAQYRKAAAAVASAYADAILADHRASLED